MAETVTLSSEEYRELKHKAELLDEILEEESLTEAELARLKRAEKSDRMSEAAFFAKHPELHA